MDELDLALLRADVLGRELPRELRAAAARIAAAAPAEHRRAIHEVALAELAVAIARAEAAFVMRANAAQEQPAGAQ